MYRAKYFLKPDEPVLSKLNDSDSRMWRMQREYLVKEVWGTQEPELKLARQHGNISTNGSGIISQVFTIGFTDLVTYNYFQNIFDEYMIVSGSGSFHMSAYTAATTTSAATSLMLVGFVDYADSVSVTDFDTALGFDTARCFAGLHPNYKLVTIRFHSQLPPDIAWTSVINNLVVCWYKLVSLAVPTASTLPASTNVGAFTSEMVCRFRQIRV